LANLVQDLILVSSTRSSSELLLIVWLSENRTNQRTCRELQGASHHRPHLNLSGNFKTWSCSLSSTFFPHCN
jgi:hypothetical protein